MTQAQEATPMPEPTPDDVDALLRSKAGIHDLMAQPAAEAPEAEAPAQPDEPRPTPLPGGNYAPVHAPPGMEDWIRKQVRVLKYGADPRGY